MPPQMTLPQPRRDVQEDGRRDSTPSALSDPLAAPLAAVVSLGGCTASFVSPDGLIVTNHHCVQGALAASTRRPENNLVENGFLAKTRADEKSAGPTAARDGRAGVSATSPRRCATGSTRSRTRSRARRSPRSGMKDAGRRVREGAARAALPGVGVLRRRPVPADRDTSRSRMSASSTCRRARSATTAARSTTGTWPRHTGDWSFYRAYVGKDGKPADYSPDNVPVPPQALAARSRPPASSRATS